MYFKMPQTIETQNGRGGNYCREGHTRCLNVLGGQISNLHDFQLPGGT